MMRRLLLLGAGALWIAFAPVAAAAMELNFEHEPGLLSGDSILRIKATGEIVEGDSDAFKALMTKVLAENKGARPTVQLDSPGGNVIEGLLLGYAIRHFDLPTFIPRGASCASACTFAFLGGTERYVEGAFEIHAMSIDPQVAQKQSADADKLRMTLDSLQNLSSLLIGYTREMTGRSDMAETALRLGSVGVADVSDDSLRDWNVITHANRPSQRFPATTGPLSKCSDMNWQGQNIGPRGVLCDNLTVARDEMDIEDAIARLAGKPLAADMQAEQTAFDAYWEGCEAPTDIPSSQWHVQIENCVKSAFDARARELKALVEYYSVGEADPAKSHWSGAQ